MKTKTTTTEFHRGDRVQIIAGETKGIKVPTGRTGTIADVFPDGYNINLDELKRTYYFQQPELAATGEASVKPTPKPAPAPAPKKVADQATVRTNAANKAWATRRAVRAQAAVRLEEAVTA